MLRFFRQYMKYILAVFVALLMVAFLIQPTLSMFGPDPAGEVIGTIGSDELTIGDQRRFNTQIRILEQISPSLLHLAGNTPGQPPTSLHWLLMLRDAQAQGLAASPGEIDSLLETIGRSQAELKTLAKNMGVSVSTLRAALANWLVVQSYKELVSGLVHAPVAQRVEHYTKAGQYIQYGYYPGALVEIESAFKGSPRLSRPLLERFLYDHRATVGVTAVVVPVDAYTKQAAVPSEAALVEMFELYKTFLPGEGEPYGLGYRIPERVKVEYLAIPIELVSRQTRVEEADALGYYDTHLDEFRSTPPAAGQTQLQADSSGQPAAYEQVRDEIIDRLKSEQADRLADRMVKTAQALLLEDVRQLAESGGYRTIPPGWQPVALDRIAQKLKSQFGVAPEVHRRHEQWLTGSDLARLPGVSNSSLSVNQRDVFFVQYALSTRELLDADAHHPLGAMRLQVYLPSMPLKSANGGRYLFRLIDAQASRVAGSIDEVRPQVTSDAKRLAAYRLLQADQQAVLGRVEVEGIEAWAAGQGLGVLSPPPFPKRISGGGGGLTVPSIAGIGRHEALVDTVFDLAGRVGQALTGSTESPPSATGNLDHVPASKRTVVIAVDRLMSLVVVRVDRLEPISRSRYNTIAQSPQIGAWINQTLMAEPYHDPLALVSLFKRVGFVPSNQNDSTGE